MLKHMSDYFNKSIETYLVEEFGTYAILGRPNISLEDYALN